MTVHFIGAGPGAADLLTVRAVNLLRTSPVCLYAGTYLDPEVLAHCVPDTELIDTQHLDIDQIIDHLARANASGKDVARLCSGDPSIYSALTEQTRRLDALDIPWDVTPGVPAYAAAAALLGTELTVPELVQSVVLTRTQARSTAMPDSESLVNFAQTGATLVLHLAITRIRTLATELIPGYGSDCPVAVVYRASQPEQQVVRGTLTDIADQVEAAGLRQAAIILVGRALTDSLSCAQSHLYDPARDRHVST
jgi:precorrin-4/cobalt-precorrin-4 C11-methyltransferase